MAFLPLCSELSLCVYIDVVITWTQVSCIAGRFFTIWVTTGKPSHNLTVSLIRFWFLQWRLFCEENKQTNISASLFFSLSPFFSSSFLLSVFLFLLLFLYSGFSWWSLIWRTEFFRERGKGLLSFCAHVVKGIHSRSSGAIFLVLLFWVASVLFFSMNQHYSQLSGRWLPHVSCLHMVLTGPYSEE